MRIGARLLFGAMMSFVCSATSAQSTDGFHGIQIFPVVVDSTSFTQRFDFQVPQGSPAATVSVKYFPGTGVSGSPLSCPTFQIPANGRATFVGLRALCPGLPAGSVFGYLYTWESSSLSTIFSGFSRVSNAAGSGFSVEAFPAHTFTSADVIVSGARRISASPGGPAYQTNCFVGNLQDETPPAQSLTQVVVSVLDQNLNEVAGIAVPVSPGQLTRLLDVFAATGVPAGDMDNATIRFRPVQRSAGLMAFCTVQDNTSFGADFRIAKQERGYLGGSVYRLGSADDHVNRFTSPFFDQPTSDSPGVKFQLGDGNSANTHVIYFRHPDWIQCELIEPSSDTRFQPPNGLEMRMIANDGQTVVAGGNDVGGFDKMYLGDKSDRNNGRNSRYTIEVEYNETIAPQARTGIEYVLRCRSGSGHTMGELIRYRQPVDRF